MHYGNIIVRKQFRHFRMRLHMIKNLLKITLFAIQLVFLYMVLNHDSYYLVPIQMVIVLIVLCI